MSGKQNVVKMNTNKHVLLHVTDRDEILAKNYYIRLYCRRPHYSGARFCLELTAINARCRNLLAFSTAGTWPALVKAAARRMPQRRLDPAPSLRSVRLYRRD